MPVVARQLRTLNITKLTHTHCVTPSSTLIVTAHVDPVESCNAHPHLPQFSLYPFIFFLSLPLCLFFSPQLCLSTSLCLLSCFHPPPCLRFLPFNLSSPGLLQSSIT